RRARFRPLLQGSGRPGRLVPVLLPLAEPGGGSHRGGRLRAPSRRRASQRDVPAVRAGVPARLAPRGRAADIRGLRPAAADDRGDPDGQSGAGSHDPARARVLSDPPQPSTAGDRPPPGVSSTLARLAPGLLAAIAIAVVARLATIVLPAVVSEVTIAILIGLVVGRL